MTKQEREPIAWVTKGGKHIPIFADEPNDDEKKKDRQIAENKKQAEEKNKYKDKPSDIQINNRYVRDNRGYIDVDKSDIKKLYHWVWDDKTADFVDKNGIVKDDQGLLYLSDKPYRKDRGHLYEVTIDPTNKRDISDWREFWYDDNGNEIDSDHQYDKDNPYFISTQNIPKKYLKKNILTKYENE